MKAAFVIPAFAGAIVALPQAVTDTIEPEEATPSDCSTSYDSNFQIAVVGMDEMNKRDIAEILKRSTCGEDKLLEMTLDDGVLKDAQDRTGYIASNYQFQFDDPPQAGSIYTGGFSVCDNSSLALGASTTWYQCLSGDFYNLYTEDWAEQCEPIGLVVLECDGTAASGDEMVVDSDVALPICQIGDGQIQAHTTPCVTVTATPGVTTTYEVSTPEATNPPATTAPTTVPEVSSVYNTTATSEATSEETSAAETSAAETTTGEVSPTETPEGSSGVARLGGSIGALVVGLMAAFFTL